jgi:hypothetical protein
MNGIITFDDGSGTVIEDGVIITDSFSTANFNATNLSATDIQTGTLTATGNLNALSVTTDTIEATTSVGSKIVNIYDNLGVNDSVNIGSDCATKLAGAVVIEPTVSNFYSNSMLVSPTYVKTNTLQSIATGDNPNLYTTTTGNLTLGSSGKINLGNTINITGNTIASTSISNTVNLFSNITTGTVNLLSGIRTSGALNIASNTSDLLNTAPVNIGGTNTSATVGDISRINLNLNGDTIWSNTNTLTSFRSNGINLATVVGVTGTINIGAEAGTTSNVNIGRSGASVITLTGTTTALNATQVRIPNQLWFSATATPINIDCPSAAIGIDFFKPFRTGDVNICTLHQTGTIYVGNTTGTTDGALGNVVIGNSDNNLTTSDNGICQINKLKVGSNGTPYRCMIMETIGAGLGGDRTYTIPNAPTTFGNPIVVTSINVNSANAVYVYSVNSSVLNATQFRYRKRRWNGSLFDDASTESINYVAYWL